MKKHLYKGLLLLFMLLFLLLAAGCAPRDAEEIDDPFVGVWVSGETGKYTDTELILLENNEFIWTANGRQRTSAGHWKKGSDTQVGFITPGTGWRFMELIDGKLVYAEDNITMTKTAGLATEAGRQSICGTYCISGASCDGTDYSREEIIALVSDQKIILNADGSYLVLVKQDTGYFTEVADAAWALHGNSVYLVVENPAGGLFGTLKGDTLTLTSGSHAPLYFYDPASVHYTKE